MKCCVYVRFVYEYPYLSSFIEHYLTLGFDKIIMLYTDIISYPLADNLSKFVDIYYVENRGNKSPHEYKDLIPKDMDWVLHVDSDEFLLLHHRYHTIKDFINAKLAIKPNINIFAFMWSWLHKLDYHENNELTINEIILKYKKTVGNRLTNNNYKGKKEVWIKSMFKYSELEHFHVHCPSLKNEYHISLNNSFLDLDTKEKIKSFVIDNEQEPNFYSDAILMHIATRDLKNSIFKSINLHCTQLQKKKMKNKDEFINFLYTYLNEISDERLLKHFKDKIGYKIEWPFTCVKKMKNINQIRDIRNYLRKGNMKFSHGLQDYYDMHKNMLQDIYVINAINKVINRYNCIFIE